MNPDVNTVQYIISNSPLTFEDKVSIKQKGRPMPVLEINSTSTYKSRIYKRHFHKNIYDKYNWICGCEVTNKLFCFFCLLFKKKQSTWTKDGVNDLQHIGDRAKKHGNSVAHLTASVDYNVLGKIDIRKQLNRAYLETKLKHIENVEKNRLILQRLIMCIKFCGAFELALQGHNESISSDNPDIYIGLINYAAELDSVLAAHIKEAKIFKDTSKTIQNELLDAIFDVYKTEVINEIKSANFIALEADKTANQQQMVVIIRYVSVSSDQIIKICERFWSFIKLSGYTADDISNTLLAELHIILDSASDKSKLIAQSYDGTSVMSDKNNGVQAIIKKTFPNANFVHSYAHQFNLIIERALQCNKNVKVFFANLQAFSSFFSRSPKHMSVLDEVAKKLLPHAVPTRWNFECRTANTLYEHTDLFLKCLETIMDADGVDSKTLNEANGLINSLKCPEFLYWLKIFHFIMPHVEIFFNETQAPIIDSLRIQEAVETFEKQIIRIRSCIDSIISKDEEEPVRKRQKIVPTGDTRGVVAKEVCDIILAQTKERFNFKDHLRAVKLFESGNFKNYRRIFPQNYFDSTVMSYPMLDSVKLKSELTVIYSRDDMCDVDGVFSLLVFISDNNLINVLTETYKLLDIICTTPMLTSECERCFSTLKKVKTFLRSTITDDRLNALAVLSIEKKFIQSIPEFDNKVIDTFSKHKGRRMDFIYSSKKDLSQVLFRPCGKVNGDVECNTPIEAIYDDSTCRLHMEIPSLRSYNQLRKDSESDLDDSAETSQFPLHFSDNVKTELLDYNLPPEIPKMETLPSLLFEETQNIDINPPLQPDLFNSNDDSMGISQGISKHDDINIDANIDINKLTDEQNIQQISEDLKQEHVSDKLESNIERNCMEDNVDVHDIKKDLMQNLYEAKECNEVNQDDGEFNQGDEETSKKTSDNLENNINADEANNTIQDVEIKEEKNHVQKNVEEN